MSRTRLPDRIVAFECSDKVGKVERWSPRRAQDIGNFPSPARILLVGPPHVGKSTLVKNLIIHQKPAYQEVYIVHPDQCSTEWDDLEPTDVLLDIPPLEFWSELPSHNSKDEPIKRAIILDDVEFTSSNKEQQRNLATLLRYCSSHKFLSVYICHQSYFDLPPLAKKMASIFIIWKPRSRNEVALIENRCGLMKHALRTLFQTIATGPQDSICVDHTQGSPSRLRLNIWQPIDEDDYAAI